MGRILVFTPTYGGLLQAETVASVARQRLDGVPASAGWIPASAGMTSCAGTSLVHVIDDRELEPGASMREVCVKYRDARRMALDGGYDALLCVEHDMILPDGCVQALWDTPAPVVYAAYMLRHGIRVVNLFRKTGGRNIGMSLSLYPGELRRARRRAVIEVSGSGFGCTLMRREALERAPFRVMDDNPPDLAFAGDCLRAGVRQMGRFDVACLHVDIDSGDILSIDDDSGVVARVEALQDVTVLAGGETIRMRRGRYYSVPVQDALELERAGYVRISNGAGEGLTTEGAEDAEGREVAVAPEAERATPPRARKKRKPRPRKRATKEGT